MDNLIEINEKNYEKFSNLDAQAFLMETGGSGNVGILTTDGNCYKANMRGGYPLPVVLPLLDKIEEDPADHPELIPDGWSFRHSFVGDYLFYRDTVKEQLEKEYLNKLPMDVMGLDWDTVVKTIRGDRSARIELMNEYFETVRMDVSRFTDAIHQYKYDKEAIELLHKYLTSGQLEEDRKALERGEVSDDQPHDILREHVLETLFKDIANIKTYYEDDLKMLIELNFYCI